MNKIINVREVECDGVRTLWGFFPKGANEEGYGKKISTRYEVQYSTSKRWYKVYCCCYSNVGTMYTAKGSAGVGQALTEYKNTKNKE